MTNIKILDTPYGICHLSVVPMRLTPDEGVEMVTRLLFGELLQALERRNSWGYIRLLFDNAEGWIDNNQVTEVPDRGYRKSLEKKDEYAHKWLTNLRLKTGDDLFLHIPEGATFSHNHLLYTFQSTQRPSNRGVIITILEYLGVPYLPGGRTPFGIDASGLAQMVSKLNGTHLPRTADRQTFCRSTISFTEGSQVGDLAFFDDEEGNVIRVGVLSGDNKTIHPYGKVRIDRSDHISIFNSELRSHTHQLRTVRTMVSEKLTTKG